MSNPFRRAFEDTVDDGSFSSALIRNSLLAAESKFYPPRQAYLSVEILGSEAEAYLSSQVALSVSDAAAYFAKALESPQKENVRITNSFRRKVGIRNAGTVGNRIILGFNARQDDPQTPLIDESRLPSLGESSARSLTLALPSEESDNATVENSVALLDAERNGLFNLSRDLGRFNRTIKLDLTVNEETGSSGVLTPTHARSMYELLMEARKETWKIEVNGRLDGMRSRRRQFFLEADNRNEIAGTIDPDLLTELPKFIDKRVTASIKCVRMHYASGRTGKIAYRLESIRPLSEPTVLM